MTPPSFINPDTIRIKRSPSRNGAIASETEPKISRFEAISENSFFFIVKSPNTVARGEQEEGHTCDSKRHAAAALVHQEISKVMWLSNLRVWSDCLGPT